MAIAYDNSTSGRVVDTNTASFVVASGATLFVVTEYVCTGITYNSVALTNIVDYDPAIDSNSVRVKVWKLDNPDSGTHNLSFSVGGGVATSFSAVTYTGLRPSQPEANNNDKSFTTTPSLASTQVSSFTSSVTTIKDNAWAVMFILGGNNASQTFTAGASTTLRASHGDLSTSSSGILDSNGVVSPAGSRSLVANWSSGSGYVSSVTVSIAPVSVPAAPTIGAVAQVGSSATVAFSDNDNGGSAITGHTATSTPGGLTGTGSSPITVSGLNGGVSYTFTVHATNAIGNSAESSASSALTLSTGLLSFF